MGDERRQIIASVKEATGSGARLGPTCETMGISPRTYQRWNRPDNFCDRRPGARREPSNKLGEEERRKLLEVTNSPEYSDLPPCKIVPLLADSGQYLASESTFYRALREKGQLSHRHSSKPPSGGKPRGLLAAGPNCVYSWDITYLPTRVKGMFFYLYMVMDIYSRKIVGWQVHKRESSELAADLMTVFFRGVVAYYVSLALTITSNNFHVKLFSVISSGFFAVIRVKPYLSYLRPVSRLT